MSSTSTAEKLEANTYEDVNHRGHFANANQPPPPPPAIARPALPNGAALGLFSFGATCIGISLYTAGASGVAIPNAIVGLALFTGGVAQYTGGVVEFARGVTYTGSVFCIYATFWLSYAAVLLPNTGIVAAYADDPKMLGNALGIYFVIWSIITVMFLLTALRKTLALVILLSLLSLTFLFFGITQFTHGNSSVAKATGVIGTITGFGAFYVGLGELLGADPNPPFLLPQGVFKH
ncbi:Gpr1 family protein [Armillaria nabsnona]|nr:Gpr1 family protein [Armillaria nabsnona]